MPTHDRTVEQETAGDTGVAEAVAAKPNAGARRRSRQQTMPPSGETMRSRNEPLVPAVMGRAADMGLLTTETHQVGARLPVKLLEQAKRRTGIGSTTELLAFALANVALEDNFAKAFAAARGKLDPDLDIGL